MERNTTDNFERDVNQHEQHKRKPIEGPKVKVYRIFKLSLRDEEEIIFSTRWQTLVKFIATYTYMLLIEFNHQMSNH